MRVKREMSVLKRRDEIVGYVRASWNATRLDVKVCIRDKSLANGMVALSVGEDEASVAKLMDGNADITLDAHGNNSGIYAIVVSDGEVVARSSYISYEMASRLYEEVARMAGKRDNSNAYSGDIAHSETNIVSENLITETDTDIEYDERDLDSEDAMHDVMTSDNADSERSAPSEIILSQSSEDSIGVVGDTMSNNEHFLDEPCDITDKMPFYEAISGELAELFAHYEREIELENAITNSTFARIYYDADRYYVVGTMSDEKGRVRVLCYGYPGEGGDNPPSEVDKEYEWLPLDRKNKHGRGYYMMYQNPVTGDIITS